MRLLKPNKGQIIPASKQFFSITSHGYKEVTLKVGVLLLIVSVITLSILSVITEKPTKSTLYTDPNARPPDANHVLVNELKNSDKPEEIKTLIAAYLASKQYDKAEVAARGIAEKSQASTDFIGWLSICVAHQVTNKETCINEAITKLKPLISKMDFFSAYSVGSLLVEAGKKKEAVDFYVRAFETYDSKVADEYTMSKDKLKSHIDELRK